VIDVTELAAHVGDVDKTFKVKAGRGGKVKLSALRRISLDVAAGEAVAIVGDASDCAVQESGAP